MEKLNGLHGDYSLKKEMSHYVKEKTLLVNMCAFEGYKSLRDEFCLGHFIWACVLYCKCNYCANGHSSHGRNLGYSWWHHSSFEIIKIIGPN